MISRSRRAFLKASAGVAGGCLLGEPAVTWASSANVQTSPAERLMPFPLASIRLTAGIFREQEAINARFLESLNVDRLLYSFRATAGISSSASPYMGWEAPTCELRGHFNGGHFLSAVALASAGSGNSVLKSRGDQLVAGLAECQKRDAPPSPPTLPGPESRVPPAYRTVRTAPSTSFRRRKAVRQVKWPEFISYLQPWALDFVPGLCLQDTDRSVLRARNNSEVEPMQNGSIMLSERRRGPDI